jgi:hypothetical protein
MQPVSKQRIGKHASTIMELVFETVFYIRSVQSVYKEGNWGDPVAITKIVVYLMEQNGD